MDHDRPGRRRLHNRTVVFDGYLRDDGLWEFEAQLTDTKSYVYDDRERGPLAPGRAIHRIGVRLTVDDDLVVRSVEPLMHEIPFSICGEAGQGASALVGTKVGQGWRRAVDEGLLGTKGCSHLRELLYNVATVVFQTVSPFREQNGGTAPRKAGGAMPFFLGGCYSWALERSVVARFFPQHVPPERREARQSGDAATDPPNRKLP
ncbi:MAG: DUF2889 domain-containing protein [Alphaproteobacteria bacterium]